MHKSGTVAIDVHFRFEHAGFHCEKYFRFHSLQQDDKKRCGSNMTFLLITRQLICAPNVRSVKGDAARTRKKICKFMIHAENSVRIAIDAVNFDASLVKLFCTASLNVKVIAYSFCLRERKYDFIQKLPPSRPPLFLVSTYL